MLKKRIKKSAGERGEPLIIAVWNPLGNSTARVTMEIAEELSGYAKTIAVEMPDLGIPRLAAVAGLEERDNHLDNVLLDYERTNNLSIEGRIVKKNNLHLLAANRYAAPELPTVTHKIEKQTTLVQFPSTLTKALRTYGYHYIVYDLQGQLSDPLTSLSIFLADMTLLPVRMPEEIGWSATAIERLTRDYGYNESKMKVYGADEMAESAAKALKIGRIQLYELIGGRVTNADEGLRAVGAYQDSTAANVI